MLRCLATLQNGEAALLKVNNNPKVSLFIFETSPQSSPWNGLSFALFSAVFLKYFSEWL